MHMESWRFRVVAVVVVGLSTTGLSRAQSPPIRGEGGVTEFFQGRAVRTFSQFIIVDRLLIDGDEQPNSQRMRVLVYIQPFAFNLAPAPNFNVTIIAPIVVKHLTNVVQPDLRTTRGFGDLILQGKYRFWKKLSPGSRTDFAALAGLKLPTGSTGARDAAGNRLPIPAQVGTGSTDGFVQGAISHENIDRGFALFGDWRYTARTEGKGYEFGDTVELDWGAKKRLYPWRYTSELKPVEFHAELAFLYSHATRDRDLSVRVASSGGDAVFWAPGITIVKRRFLFEGSFQFPITQRLNGTQLGQGWNVLFGTRIIY